MIMATKNTKRGPSAAATTDKDLHVAMDTESLLLAALESGGDGKTTGRYIMTFKEGATDAGIKNLETTHGLRMADARDFKNQATVFEQAAGADAVVFPEIGVALLGGAAATSRGLTASADISDADPTHSIDPEYFMFADGVNADDYLRGVIHTAQMIARDLGSRVAVEEAEVTPSVLGVTWGLIACKVPPSLRDGTGIKVAILDTGFDMGHPDFAGRSITTNTFVGQSIQDMVGHGTHTTGTACGPKSPAGAVQRYGIAFKSQIFAGKVLNNSGSGTQAQSLAGMNWAVVNKCQVISMSLGAQVGVQPSYTSAGAAALAAGCLIIAAAGNASNRPGTINPCGAPANSPTIMSVGALDSSLHVAVFSNGGKIDIAGPGVDVFSSWPRPILHKTISGTSMATPHVSGCAALWAQSSATLRGAALRAKLLATAKHLPLPASDVGAGLVQAP